MTNIVANSETGIVLARTAKPEGRARLPTLMIDEFGWIWIATGALFAASAWIAPGTVRTSSLVAMLPFAAMLAIVAVGQTIVIQQRGLDMSCAAIVSLGGLVVAQIGFSTGSILIGLMTALAVAIVAGVINGLLIAKLNIIPIVATLATNAIYIGGILTVSGGSPMSVPRLLETFSHEKIAGIPSTLALALIFIVFVAVVTKMTPVGRRFVAVGANPRAAAAAGIPLLTYQVGTYAAAAICFAVAGMLYAGFIGSASHIAGNDYLLPGIAAVVVGGTPFSGGRGSVVASGIAALFMTQLGQLVLALGAGSSEQLFVQASAIVVAVAIRNVPDWISR
jgi:ribose transport system permease protein